MEILGAGGMRIHIDENALQRLLMMENKLTLLVDTYGKADSMIFLRSFAEQACHGATNKYDRASCTGADFAETIKSLKLKDQLSAPVKTDQSQIEALTDLVEELQKQVKDMDRRLSRLSPAWGSF